MIILLQRLAGTVLACIGLLSATHAVASTDHRPFGFRQGMSMAEVQAITKLSPTEDPYVFQTFVPPAPNPDFGMYLLTISPTQGLCGFLALGIGVVTTPDGAGTRRQFEKLKGELRAQYGAPTTDTDGIKAGVQPKPTDTYMDGIVARQRVLTAHWQRAKGASLPASLDTVALLTGAIEPNVAKIGVLHHFANFPACEREQAEGRKNTPTP